MTDVAIFDERDVVSISALEADTTLRPEEEDHSLQSDLDPDTTTDDKKPRAD